MTFLCLLTLPSPDFLSVGEGIECAWLNLFCIGFRTLLPAERVPLSLLAFKMSSASGEDSVPVGGVSWCPALPVMGAVSQLVRSKADVHSLMSSSS